MPDTNSVSPLPNIPDNKKENKSTWIIVILLLLGVFSVGYVYVTRNQNQAALPLTTHRTLLSISKNYKDADSLNSQREYGKALEQFNAALNDANTLTQEVLIRFRIAEATSYAGDSLKAVELFKDIVDNPKYESDLQEVKQAKAYALILLSGIWYQTHDKSVIEKIFSGKPYEDFIKKEDDKATGIASRRLYEYASSLSSPSNLLPEAGIAVWYGVEMYHLNQKKILNEEEKKQLQEYKDILKLKLTHIKNNYLPPQNYYENVTLPALLKWKAVAMGSLWLNGDASMGNPEQTFLQALSLPQAPWSISQIKFSYAIFLAAAYGEERKDDIKNLLSDLYIPSSGTEFNWHMWLLNEKAYPTRSEDVLPLLASVDPKFKALLISLGWKL